MKVSVILLDWSVRESFHPIDYLNEQSADRRNYELVWVEYFERKVPALEEHYRNGHLDQYLVLGNKPGDYHKHEAWNTGVLHSSGDIAVLCDSDVMFGNSFIQKIIDFFESHGNSFLYIDEIRSENKCFWPFSHPAWEEVMAAPGLANWDEKRRITAGLAPEYAELPLYRKMFVRNYGACLCVRKSDYIRFGGLDEHYSYLGYICGPYDLAVRMINGGMQENWHDEEFLLHTYHPREKPGIDRMGPHFRNNSTTSLKHIYDGNVMPFVENRGIRAVRKQMFPEMPREGCPKFSIIVPGAHLRLIQPLYDSVKNATKLPFEVLCIGEEEFNAEEEGLKYIKLQGLLSDSILTGCRNAVGEIIVIVPPQAVFRQNALDMLLDFRMKLTGPVVYLNAMETFIEGFIWKYCNEFVCGNEVWRMAAFQRELLPEDLSETGLRKIMCSGDGSHDTKECVTRTVPLTPFPALEIWHDSTSFKDEKLQPILDKMLELKYELSHGGGGWDKAGEAKNLLERIHAVEKMAPGNFLKYCFTQRYSLSEYCYFVSIFQKLNWTEVAVKGYQLLINCASILTKNINENIKEAAWLYELLSGETSGFIGAAHFNLAMHELYRGEREKAAAHLKTCLELIPGFGVARKVLESIS